MKYFFVSLLVFCAFSITCLAQSNYKTGYVVNLKGDTIKGAVDYKEWLLNPDHIFFKPNAGSVKKYIPADITFFGVDGFEYYRSAIVTVSQGEVITSRITADLDTTSILDTVFLKVQYNQPQLSLYSYTDKIKERYYISDANGQPTELIYNVYLNSDRTTKLTQATYKRQLQKIAANNHADNALLTDIQQANYKQSDLKKIVMQITNTKNSTLTMAKSTGSRFFAGIGGNIASTSFSRSTFYTNANSNTSVLPKLTIGADIFFNKNVGKLIFRNELFVTGNNFNLTYSGISNTPYTGEVKFKQLVIGYNPQAVYNFYNQTDTKAYFSIGGVIGHLTSKKTTDHIKYQVDANTVIERQNDKPVEFKTMILNISVKAGVTLKKRFDIYASYYPSESINTNQSYNLNYSSVHIGFNYLFGNN
jgi:hypothetical protein